MRIGALKIFSGNSLVSGSTYICTYIWKLINLSWTHILMPADDWTVIRKMYLHLWQPSYQGICKENSNSHSLFSAKLFLQRWWACRSLGEKNGKQYVDTDILRSILSKYNHNLTIILITIIEMFTLHEPVFERAA